MTRTLEEIEALEKELGAEKKQAIKEGKKDAVDEVKRLILKHSLTKGDIRGKALKQIFSLSSSSVGAISEPKLRLGVLAPESKWKEPDINFIVDREAGYP